MTFQPMELYQVVSKKRYLGCLVWGPNTRSRHATALKKNVYGNQACMWLPIDHPYRFDNVNLPSIEMSKAPIRMSIVEHLRATKLRAIHVYNGETPRSEDPTRVFRINWLFSLRTLLYWEVNSTANHLSNLHLSYIM